MSPENIIVAENINKTYTPQTRFSFGGLWRRPAEKPHHAVKNIDLSIQTGEFVGLLGPNGAGKSTLIKMLTGVLLPTSGTLMVSGLVPHRNRTRLAMNMGVVFGQRTQLWWNLPLRESYQLLKEIYQVPSTVFRENLELFEHLLGLDKLLDVPVRQLSLGQRMQAEIVASLLHNPPLLFLDEPTIGVDIVAKEKIRSFLTQVNQHKKVTIVLTTHDMQDIERLVDRTVIINHGEMIFDGSLSHLLQQHGTARRIEAGFRTPHAQLPDFPFPIQHLQQEKGKLVMHVEQPHVADAVRNLMQHPDLQDIVVKEHNLEALLMELYHDQTHERQFA